MCDFFTRYSVLSLLVQTKMWDQEFDGHHNIWVLLCFGKVTYVIFKNFREYGFSTLASEIMPTFLWLMYHICVESNIFPEIFSKYSGFSLPKFQLSYVSNHLSIHCSNEEPVWAFLIIAFHLFEEKKQWEEIYEHKIALCCHAAILNHRKALDNGLS